MEPDDKDAAVAHLERDALALKLVCAFNGVDEAQAPPAWWWHPNASNRDAWRRVADVVYPQPGPYRVGQIVHKQGGDYSFVGDVRACYTKRSGVWRVVVENDAGLNHIFNPGQLRGGFK